jgi:hypothetical protein
MSFYCNLFVYYCINIIYTLIESKVELTQKYRLKKESMPSKSSKKNVSFFFSEFPANKIKQTVSLQL